MTGLVKVMSLPTCTATSNKYCSSCLPQYTLVTLIFIFFLPQQTDMTQVLLLFAVVLLGIL